MPESAAIDALPRLPEKFSIADTFPDVPQERWRETVDGELAGKPFEKRLMSRLYEGFSLRPLYTRQDFDHSGQPSGWTGLSPMTRGPRPLSTAITGWDVRTERREPLPDMLAARVMDDLEHGATSILLRLDVAARQGLDPDDPRAAGLVGRDGGSIATVDDLDRVFRGVHLGMITLALEAGAAYLPAAAQVMALWERRGLPGAEARGHFNADPLAVLARDGALPMPLDDAMNGLAALAAHTAETYPGVRAVRVGVAPYHHAGATATQDLAFAIATGVEYLRAMTDRGVPLEAASNQLVFSFAIGCNQFLAMGKLRAARRLWARVIQECGGSDDAARMTMHVRTSKRVLTHRDPWVNLLRNTTCCFAAGVAGADTITSTPFDDALGLPSQLARRIARNTQIILQEEAHVHRVADPGGGSWFIESLTDELAGRAWEIFREIERQGGMSRALAGGWVGEQIESAFAPRRENLATRRDPVLGVSEFPVVNEKAVERVEVDARGVLGQARARVMAQKQRPGVGSAAAETPAMASITGDRVRLLASAAADGATIGDIAARLGLHAGADTQLPAPIAPHSYAEPFEALRDEADALAERTGSRPAVYLVSVGSIPEHQARAGFSRNMFEAGGFEVIEPRGPATTDPQEAAAAFAESGVGVAVICSTDARYPDLVPELAPALHRAGARRVVLAGAPGEQEKAYRAAGVDTFIFMRCDALGILREILAEETVL